MTPTRRRQPSTAADPAFLRALAEIAGRIASTLTATNPERLPVRMYLAGGAAMHYYTGSRSTEDLDVYYVNARGEHRLLYFDRQYNDTLGLLHEDAREASIPLRLPSVDASVLEVRALAPIDLAISKIGRFEAHHQEDIAALARDGLISSRSVRRRAEQALSHYVGNADRVRNSIELACRMIDANAPGRRPAVHQPGGARGATTRTRTRKAT
jgi:hypothetical protein